MVNREQNHLESLAIEGKLDFNKIFVNHLSSVPPRIKSLRLGPGKNKHHLITGKDAGLSTRFGAMTRAGRASFDEEDRDKNWPFSQNSKRMRSTVVGCLR